MAECLPERQGREDPDGKTACGEAGTSCLQNRPIQGIGGRGCGWVRGDLLPSAKNKPQENANSEAAEGENGNRKAF